PMLESRSYRVWCSIPRYKKLECLPSCIFSSRGLMLQGLPRLIRNYRSGQSCWRTGYDFTDCYRHRSSLKIRGATGTILRFCLKGRCVTTLSEVKFVFENANRLL